MPRNKRNRKKHGNNNNPICNQSREEGSHDTHNLMAASSEAAYAKPSITILPVSRATECGFCCLKLEEIQEPRALPCGHTQCTDCIWVNYQDGQIECKICRNNFCDVDIKSLPLVPEETVDAALAEHETSATADQVRCVRCTEQSKKAVVYCADCKKSFCHDHAEDHLFHVSDHELLPIENDFTRERYEIERCPLHSKHVLDEICSNCKRLFCKRCNSKEECVAASRQGKSMQHEVVALKVVTGEMREKLRKLSEDIHEKINRCRNQEKSSWKSLANLEEHVETIHIKIDKMAQELIDGVKLEAEKLKAEFTQHVDQSSEEVNQYSEGMLLDMTSLDDLYSYGVSLADKRSDKQLLEEFEEVATNMTEKSIDQNFENPHILKTPYLHTGANPPSLHAQMRFPPTNLQHLKTNSDVTIYGVNWTYDGNLHCAAAQQGLKVYSKDLQLSDTISLAEGSQAFSSAAVGSKLVTHGASTTMKTYVTYCGSLEQPCQSVLHSESDDKLNQVSHISANESITASIFTVSKTLKLFSTDQKNLLDINLADMIGPYGVHMLANSVLVTDFSGGCLYNYDLLDSKTPIWICRNLSQPAGIATDDSDFIYVSSNNKPIIYIISPEGKLIKEITHEKLGDCIEKKGYLHDIAISGEKMAVACRDVGVMLFNIKR